MLDVIVVTWNSSATIERALRSILDDVASYDARVIVIDNHSSDDTVCRVRSGFPGVEAISNEENRGYTQAINQAIGLTESEYLFFVNPDVELHVGCAAGLLDALKARPFANAVGPILYWPDGRVQSAGHEFVGLRQLLKRYFWPRQWQKPKLSPAISEVDWVTGACMLTRRASLVATGGFLEDFWMYSEDMHWCWVAQGLGWQSYVTHAARATHYHSVSARQNYRLAVRSDVRSLLRWIRIYTGRFAVLPARILIALGLLLRAMLSVFRCDPDGVRGRWRLSGALYAAFGRMQDEVM